MTKTSAIAGRAISRPERRRREERGDRRKDPGRPAAPQVEVLEGAVADRRDHQVREDDRQAEQAAHPDAVDTRRSGVASTSVTIVAGRRRDRKADEVALVGHVRLDVETRQAHRAADDEEERGHPAEAVEVGEAPGIGQHRGRHAEGHEVGERVVLLAELRGRVGQPRDAAVERVEHGRDDDRGRPRSRRCRGSRHQMREVPAEEVADGEERRQDEEAPREPLARRARPRAGASLPAGEAGLSGLHLVALARRGSRTSSGTKRSTRDPNLIRPMRCAARDLVARRAGRRRSAARARPRSA